MDLTVQIFAFSGILNGAFAMFYGVYVFLNNKNDKMVLPFVMMATALSVWSFSYWQWLKTDSIILARAWINPLTISSFFIVVFFYHWVFRLVKIKTITSLFFLYSSYLVAFCASFFVNTTLIVKDIGPKMSFPFWPTAGAMYTIVVFYLYGIVMFYALFLLISAYRNAKIQNEKSKIFFVIIGTCVAYVGGLTNFPLWFGIEIPPIFNFLVIAFPTVLGYASVKHKLFNFKAIGAELLVFFILSILFLEILRADKIFELAVRSIIFAFVFGLSLLLMRSVQLEVRNREKGERLARYLANANARLRELDQQKTEFVSIASHQLRSPIAAIKGYASMMSEGAYGKVSKELQEPLSRILESGQRIAIMVDDFLNVTRIEQGRMSYDMKKHCLFEILTDVVNELKVVAKEKNINLKINKKSSKKVCVKADEGKLKQIFSNLIDNAIKYTHEGSIDVLIEHLKEKKKVLVKIKDTGIGIAPDEIDGLFKKFNRASNANDENVLGTGLGLYIAREIIKAHEGWVNVESEGLGKGSTFTVELPVFEDDEKDK